MSRLALQSDVRAGCMTLLNGYKAAAGLRLATYRARPAKLDSLPFAWVESIAEDASAFTREESQRVVRVGIRLVWGQYDSGQSTDQRDRFIDGFYAHFMDASHPFGGNTDQTWIGTSDSESWSPPWLPEDQNLYFSTLITLEGTAST